VLLGLFPFIYTIVLSFYKYSESLGEKLFVGFGNYHDFFTDSLFWKVLANSLIFATFTVAVEFLIGFASALLMNLGRRSKSFLRVITLLPWGIPIVVAGLSFRFMYNDTFGVINGILFSSHLLHYPIAWIGDTHYALWALMFSEIWKSFPIIAFFLLAGLQVLPKELYEAAEIDGASTIQSFFLVTLPLLKRVIWIALMIRSMQAVAFPFEIVYSVTRGGPGDITQLLVTLAYKYSFIFMELGKGTTLAILALLTELMLGGVFFFFLLKRERA
jgi:ABC-type sugar transport system permease subunit